MAKLLADAVDRLLSSVTDGRAENTRYRQNQLHLLHASLKSKQSEICSAISSTSPADAETEYFLTLDAINRIYETLDFDKALKQEYLVTTGVDNVGRKVSVGLVTVKPGCHGRLCSAVVPLAAAIAAGNCILLELASSSPLDTILETTLNNSLDAETFFASTTSISEVQLEKSNLVLNQQTESEHTLQNIGHNNLAPSVAIVERSADLKLAAKSILDARLFSNGTSPYAPDLIVVNEWVLDDFRTACSSYAKSLEVVPGDLSKETQELLSSMQKTGKVHRDIPGLAVVEIADRNSELITRKFAGAVLVLLKSAGLIDSTAILRNRSSLLALYLFADTKSSKFLSDQIPSAVSYINQIPTQLLVGPASPSAYSHQLHPRYTPEMFQLARPQYVEAVGEFEKVVKDLRPTGQKDGKAIGFFEQGIFIGLGMTAAVVLPSLGYAGYRIVKVALSFWRGA